MKPRVSVVITAYNNESFIETAIRSILDQDYQDFELVVVEDSGRDRTFEFAKRFASERVRVIQNPCNLGQHRTKNEGLIHSRCDLVKFVDADDYLLPGALSHLVAAYDSAGTRPGAIFARPRIVDEAGRQLVSVPGWGFTGRVHGPSLLYFLATAGDKGSCLCNVTPHLFDRQALARVGGFPDSNAYAGDWETFLKLLSVGDVVFTDATVAGYRIQAESISRLTPIVPQTLDGIRSAREVAAFATETNPSDDRFRSRNFSSGLLDSFVDRYVYPQRLRRLVGRTSCDAEIQSVFTEQRLKHEYDRMIRRGFPGYLFRSVTQKSRSALGLSPYTPCLAGFRPAS